MTRRRQSAQLQFVASACATTTLTASLMRSLRGATVKYM